MRTAPAASLRRSEPAGLKTVVTILGRPPQREVAMPPEAHPSAVAAALQQRIRGLTRKLKRGDDSYHVEVDAIATELGALSMRLESFEPAGRTWRAPKKGRPT